jgi:hypothetical protein
MFSHKFTAYHLYLHQKISAFPLKRGMTLLLVKKAKTINKI